MGYSLLSDDIVPVAGYYSVDVAVFGFVEFFFLLETGSLDISCSSASGLASLCERARRRLGFTRDC